MLQELDKLVETNVILPMKLQRLFVEKLIRRERAMVLEVSSLATIRPVPYLSMYSASKKFSERLTRSLAYECPGRVLFKTWILTRSASSLFGGNLSRSQKKLLTKAGEIRNDRQAKSGLCRTVFNGLFTVLLPNKQRLITSLLLANYSFETTGHWLFALEYYLTDFLPQVAVNLLLEYMFLHE